MLNLPDLDPTQWLGIASLTLSGLLFLGACVDEWLHQRRVRLDNMQRASGMASVRAAEREGRIID